MRRALVLLGALAPAVAFLPTGPLSGAARQLTPSHFQRSAPGAMLPLGLGDGDDLDFPSDTGSGDDDLEDAVSAVAGAVSDAVRDPQREALKCRLYQVAAKTNRGQWADIEQRNDVINLVAQLEAIAPSQPSELEGRWELLYSDVAPFRASPFFMTVGKVIGDAQVSEDFYRLHRLATSSGEIGKVSQLITKQELVSEVEIKTGIPSIPFEIKGTVVTRASLIKDPDNTLRLSLKSTAVKGASIFSFFNDGDLPELPIGELYSRLASVPEVRLSSFYVDGDLRISRTDDEHFFVFTRSTL